MIKQGVFPVDPAMKRLLGKKSCQKGMVKMGRVNKCPSTHGGAGYAHGSHAIVYRSEKKPFINLKADVRCTCGVLIKNASPTGGKIHIYSFWENPIKWLRSETKFEEPTWPHWMSKTYKYIKV